MSETILEKVKRSLLAAEGEYHRLVLLVGGTGSGKTEVLRTLSKDLDTKIINVNLAVSAELLELTAKQRALRLQGMLDRIADLVKSPVVLDNLEILFAKGLMQDPLRLLHGISRNHLLVASWNGTISGENLKYAEAGHPEHRSYDPVDALIVSMDGIATVDSIKINERQDKHEIR